jgi:hypothetical protein
LAHISQTNVPKNTTEWVVALLLQSTQYLLYGIANFSWRNAFTAGACSILLDLKKTTGAGSTFGGAYGWACGSCVSTCFSSSLRGTLTGSVGASADILDFD